MLIWPARIDLISLPCKARPASNFSMRKYSKPALQTYVSNSDECRKPWTINYDSGFNFSTSSNIEESSLDNKYTFLGSNVNGPSHVFAGINKDYLLEYKGKSSTSRYNIGDQRSQCNHAHAMWETTPFSTFMISSSASGWFNRDSHDVFYDLIPEQALLDICINNFTFDYEDFDGEDKVLDSKTTLQKCNIIIANDINIGGVIVKNGRDILADTCNYIFSVNEYWKLNLN